MSSRILTLALMVLPGRVFTHGDGTFQAPVEVPLPAQGAVSVTVGDFDGDGRLGLAAVSGRNSVVVLNPDPANSAAWVGHVIQPVGQGNFLVRARDLDGDGDDDLVVADPTSSAYVLRSLGNGKFEDPVRLEQARGPRSVAFGDWDRDGILDLATVNHPEQSVSLFHGVGEGKFEHLENMRVGSNHHNHEIDVLDYDGDGLLDLMVAVDFSGLLPLQGQVDGTFREQPYVRNLETEALWVRSGDFNNDGLGDVVVHTRSPTTVGISRGDGSYELTARFRSFYCIPARVDLNGDGFQDLAAPVRPNALEVHLGVGDGTFSPGGRFASTFSSPTEIIGRDLNGDGRPDLIVADQGRQALQVLWGGTEDELLQVGPVLSGFGAAKGLSVADLDGDGNPEIFVAESNRNVHIFSDPGEETSPRVSLTTTYAFTSVEVVDLDGDETPDLAGTTPSGSTGDGAIVVAFLRPDGSIREEVDMTAGTLPGAVLVGRVDGNSTVDLAAPCRGSNHIAVALNQGRGRFAAVRQVPTVGGPMAIVLRHLDTDGSSDLAVISATTLAVHFGTGGGGFSDPVLVAEESRGRFTHVGAADVDRDGFVDLLVADDRMSRVYSYLGRPGRRFEAGPPLDTGAAPSASLDVADLDGNGFPDITVCGDGGAAFVFMNRRAGFSSAAVYRVPTAEGHRLADVDGDGTLDLLVLATTSLSILKGNPAEATEPEFVRGDADGNGHRNITDPVTILLRLFGGGQPFSCADAADADDSGELNLSDAVYLLNYLFTGGPAPLQPHPVCGTDTTEDGLTCRSFRSCP